MVKLQVIHRRDGSDVGYLYVPASLVQDLGWVKGDSLELVQQGQELLVRKVL